MRINVRRIGNSKGVILPARFLEALSLDEGSDVEVDLRDGRIVIERPATPSLTERLAHFDPALHGGEAIADAAVGREVP